MAVYYMACTDFANIGIAIKVVEELRKINDSFIYGKSKIVWTFGTYDLVNRTPSFFKLDTLDLTLEGAISRLYLHIDRLMVILENRKAETVQNVKLAEEILEGERLLAKETARELKIATNIFKNVDIRQYLRRNGMLED